MSREDCNILISVIIPCHNSAQTLKDTVECLHKELSKATEDCFEILIINDGSTDTTEDIAVELASSTIRIINKQQGGVSSARNRGLYDARGQYVWFFDSDDLIFDDTTEHLVKMLEQYSPDILRFSSVTVDAHTKLHIDDFNNISQHRYSFNGCLSEYYIGGGDLTFACWAQIVRRRLLIDCELRFDETLSICEDVKWNLELSMLCPYAHMLVTDLVVVKYIVRLGSIVNSLSTTDNYGQLDSVIRYNRYLHNTNDFVPPYLQSVVAAQKIMTDRKLVTRFLSCRMSPSQAKHYANKISSYIDTGTNSRETKFFIALNNLPAMLIWPPMQWIYRNIFLRYLKPRISRN